MSMKWIEPNVPEFEHGKPPPAWIHIVILVLAFVTCFVYTVLNWKQGRSIVSAEFFVRILLVPVLLGGAVSNFLYLSHEDWVERVDIWNNLCKRTYSSWRRWAQARVAIIGSVTLTPEDDLAARMLGLEGSSPTNKGKTLALATEAKGQSMSRTQRVLEQLVTPFAPYMISGACRHTFSIIVQSDRDDDLNDLRSLLRRLVPIDFGFVEISRVADPVDMGVIERWLSSSNAPEYCLVVAWQLHAAETEPTCSEAAVSLLFASRATVANSKGKLKPEAWVFRPAAAAMDKVFDVLKALLAAQQSPLERIKHLWLTRLPGPGKHATLTAIKDVKLDVAAHDLDAAIGLPGPVNTLLVQALAARMVQHGQGTQLLATPRQAGAMLNLVGTAIAPVEDIEERLPTPFGISFVLMTTCIAILVILVFKDAGASVGWFMGVLGGFIVLLIVHAIFSIVRRNQVANDFYNGLPW